MPDPKKGARPPSGPPPRQAPPPSKKIAILPPSSTPSMPGPGSGFDLPLPSDQRSKAGEAIKGALGERLAALQQIEVSEDTLIQGYRAGLFGLAALLVLQILAPGAVPSLWGTFIGGPILAGLPPNLTSSFAVLLAVLSWLAYAAMHVCQGALLRRTASGFPYSTMQVVGLALVPGYNLYGAITLFGEAAVRLERETHAAGRGALVKKLALASVAFGFLGWALLLAFQVGAEVPEVALRAVGAVTLLARLGTLAASFLMMRKLIADLFNNLDAGFSGGAQEDEGGGLPVPAAPAAISGSTGVTLIGLVLVGVIAIYAVTREELICPKETAPATTRTQEGKRVLYCAQDGIPHGPWRVRNARGKAELEQTYSRGVLTGPVIVFWPNGRVKEQGVYAKELKTGPWTTYTEAGIRVEQMFYQDGKLQGAFERYHPDGTVAERGAHTNEKLEGPWESFHPNGKKAEEGKYLAGKRFGRWKTWDTAGVQVGEENYGGEAGGPVAAVPGAPVSAAGMTPAGTPAPAAVAAAELALREVTQEQLFGGRKVEWWAERLTNLKRQADSGQMDGKLYQLTLKRAKANGLAVHEGAEVKVGPPGSGAPSP